MTKISGSPNEASTGNPLSTKEQDPNSLRSAEDLHSEMNEWRDEHDAWLEDIDLWQRKHRLAEVTLYKMERALPEHKRSLEEHAGIIRKHKQRVSTHETNLRKFLTSGEPGTGKYKALLKEHQLQRKQHLREKERHELFRRTHLAAMSELIHLAKLLKPAERP